MIWLFIRPAIHTHIHSMGIKIMHGKPYKLSLEDLGMGFSFFILFYFYFHMFLAWTNDPHAIDTDFDQIFMSFSWDCSYLYEEWKERHSGTTEDVSSKFLNLKFLPLKVFPFFSVKKLQY